MSDSSRVRTRVIEDDDPAFSDAEIEHFSRMQAAAEQPAPQRRRSLDRLIALVSWFGNATAKPRRATN
jgi:hypothetical protein